MQFINHKNNKIIVYIVFLVIFLLGMNIYKDYGLSLDDEFYRKNGVANYEYIKFLFSELNSSALNSLQSISKRVVGDLSLINHPAPFDILLAASANFFNIKKINEIYLLAHFLNFFIFFISLICFYKLISRKLNSYLYGLLSILILFFTPRIFAETFYNSRDIFFLSLFIFNIFAIDNFLQKENFKTAFYLSISSALLIIAKVFGLVSPILFLLLYTINALHKDKINKRELKFILYIITLTLIFIFILWPFLWNAPIKNLIYAFTSIIDTQNKHVVMNFYLGDFVSSNLTPWHYRIVWYLFTTPVFVLILFTIGFILILLEIANGILKLENNEKDIWKNKNQMFNFLLFFIFFIIFFLTIKFNVSKFGGIRHLYFLYPIIIFFSLYSLKKILINNKLKFIFFFLISFNMIYLFSWNFINHPHQQVFFNILFKNYAKKNLSLDYWGLSNIHAIKYIVEKNKNKKIKIGTVSFSSLEASTLMLDNKYKKNILLAYELKEADFLIDNYMKKLRNNFVIDDTEYQKYFEIVVDKVPISTVYKKIN